MSDGFNSPLGERERARSDISCQKFVYFCKRVRSQRVEQRGDEQWATARKIVNNFACFSDWNCNKIAWND